MNSSSFTRCPLRTPHAASGGCDDIRVKAGWPAKRGAGIIVASRGRIGQRSSATRAPTRAATPPTTAAAATTTPRADPHRYDWTWPSPGPDATPPPSGCWPGTASNRRRPVRRSTIPSRTSLPTPPAPPLATSSTAPVISDGRDGPTADARQYRPSRLARLLG